MAEVGVEGEEGAEEGSEVEEGSGEVEGEVVMVGFVVVVEVEGEEVGSEVAVVVVVVDSLTSLSAKETGNALTQGKSIVALQIRIST